ncbi:MAG: hypothetical protein M1480_08575 [Bacteroidetes bacterium]|nr:hypothetical protein [Bacteroidota bacterium]
MAKVQSKKNIRKAKKSISPFNIYWKKGNYVLLLIGILVIILGYIFMSMGSWDSFPSLFISPILLIIGYLLILPASILYKKKEKAVNHNEQEIASGKS